jgi:hypothetical protein
MWNAKHEVISLTMEAAIVGATGTVSRWYLLYTQ